MNTTEFEDLQKIWDMQNSRPLYAIDEKALYNRILFRKEQAYHITNLSEWLLIIVNVCSGGFVFSLQYARSQTGIAMYILATWMFGAAVYVVISRIRRVHGNRQFDRSVMGDLIYAIYLATYQVRLSQLMRWNVVPIGIFCILGLWEGGKPVWLAIVALIFFALTFYASRWEHNIYKRKKRELESLQSKLEEKNMFIV